MPPPINSMEVDVREALDRLQRGVPDHPQNKDIMARQMRQHGKTKINMRMLSRESGHSPTSLYGKFPWLKPIVAEERADPKPEIMPASDRELIQQQALRIRSLKNEVKILQAELHQLQQTNLVLQEKLAGIEVARKTAIDSKRKRKVGNAGLNVIAVKGDE